MLVLFIIKERWLNPISNPIPRLLLSYIFMIKDNSGIEFIVKLENEETTISNLLISK